MKSQLGKIVFYVLGGAAIFILGGLASLSMPNVVASFSDVGQCDVNYAAKEAFYELEPGYYTHKNGSVFWLIGGLARNVQYDGLVKRMDWNCNIPKYLESKISLLTDVTLVDKNGSQHQVYVGFVGADEEKEAEEVQETPLP